MMKIKYLGHSGFLVELEHTLLLFDYIRGELPALNPDNGLYVFASHVHGDHFDPRIFSLAHPNIRYVLSDDIPQARAAGRDALFLSPHREVCLNGVRVETLDSTDEGVAFLVETEGRSILHMGDLHRWVWDDEPAEDNARIEEKWNAELSRIAGRHFDAVFAVLDPRQEGDYWKGLDQLMRTVDGDRVYPMHMWDQPELVEELKKLPCSAPYREKLPPKGFYG